MNRVIIKFVQGTQIWLQQGGLQESLMKIANKKGDIFGYCGGQLACTTCRVYIQKKYAGLLEPPTQEEDDVLVEFENSKKYPEKDFIKRMSCQIKCSPKLHGLTVYVPETII